MSENELGTRFLTTESNLKCKYRWCLYASLSNLLTHSHSLSRLLNHARKCTHTNARTSRSFPPTQSTDILHIATVKCVFSVLSLSLSIWYLSLFLSNCVCVSVSRLCQIQSHFLLLSLSLSLFLSLSPGYQIFWRKNEICDDALCEVNKNFWKTAKIWYISFHFISGIRQKNHCSGFSG